MAAAAREAGLHMIALTDHNTAGNAPAFQSACAQEGIVAVYGAEATSSEEAHVLGLFERLEQATEFGETLYNTLPEIDFDPERYGDQVVVDDHEMIVGTLPRHLIGASSFSVQELGALIHELGGLFVPAHVDRSVFSIWSQLGFLPPDDYDAIERTAESGRIESGGFTVIANSDAHVPEHVGRRYSSFEAERPDFAAFADALRSGTVVPHGLLPRVKE
jgi:PHP family Zn ribbon phosphoesterase